MVSALISRVVILVFGTLYPAYSSYKAVKTKNVKEYVKWMMYWIVFALFTTVETFADVLVSWFPFYYELKIVFVIWLLSPVTKGASVLYRKFVHPELLKREEDIDLTLDKVKTQGYSALVNVGQQGLNFAVQSAMTGQTRVMDHLMKKSFSMGDISGQQANAAPVTFKAAAQPIIEEHDETDFPGPVAPTLTINEVQGGGRGDEGFQRGDDGPQIHHRGYNLRSHEYHGEQVPSSTTPSYNHNENQDLTSSSSEGSVKIEMQDPPPILPHQPKPPNRRRSRSRSAGRKRRLIKKPVASDADTL